MMHDAARLRIVNKFELWRAQYADRPEVMNQVLDEYLDCRDRATEWDADKWGIPTTAMLTPLGSLLSLALTAGDRRQFDVHEPAKWEL